VQEHGIVLIIHQVVHSPQTIRKDYIMKRLSLTFLFALICSTIVACGGMSMPGLDTNMPTEKAMALNAKVQGYYKALTGSIQRLESNASNIAVVPSGA